MILFHSFVTKAVNCKTGIFSPLIVKELNCKKDALTLIERNYPLAVIWPKYLLLAVKAISSLRPQCCVGENLI